MKSTGVIRKVDKLGRFVIPKEIRDQLELFCDTPLGIYVDGDRIILRKDLPACCFCENEEGLTCFRGQNICSKCLLELREAYGEKNSNEKICT